MRTRFMTALILAANLLLSGQVLAQLQLPTFQSGDVLRANDLNRIVQQVRRNTTASGGSGGATHRVSCPTQSIAAVMSQAQPGDTIRIIGTCNEAVVVDKDGITLDGGGSAVIDGSGIDLSVIAVIGRRNVTVRGLTVQNGLIGIHVGLGASAWLENVTAQGSRSKAGYNSGFGILVANSSDAVLTGSIVANDNASHGLQVWQGGRASVVGNLVFEGSRLPQVSLQANGNGVSGIDVGLGSSLQVQAPGGAYATVRANDNGVNGIWLNNGSSAQFGGGADIEATGNGDTGLSVLTGSSAVFVAWANNSRGFTGTFNGNGRIGIQVWTRASFTTWDAGVAGNITASNNRSWGLLVDGVSTAFFGSPSSRTPSKLILNDNGQVGALVADNSSLTLRMPAEIKNNTFNGIRAWGNSFIQSGTAGGATATITGNGASGIAAWNGASIYLVNATVTGNANLDVEAGQGSRLEWYDSQVDTVYCDAGTLALGDAACPSDDFEPGPLGAVEVAAGEAVQIRSLLAHDGWAAAAEAGRDAIEMAVRDFGDIHGYRVDLGLPGDSMCSPTGGRTAARAVIADEQVVGVIGTSCSGAGAAASELLSAAGLVMISPSNTSPSLTSDLEGNGNANWYPGYFRLSNNDIYTGRAAADFAYNRLNLRKMGTVDVDDVYIAGLVEAFSEAFEKLGGEVVESRILFEDEAGFDESLAAASRQLMDADVEGIFFPLYPAQATPFLRQLPQALQDLSLISADALLTPEFLGSQESEGLYIVGPITTFGNVNGVTGKSEAAVKQAIETAYGGAPGPFWQHSYDATTLLLDAIRSVAKMRGGKLYIDRAELRLQLAATRDFQGLIGAVSCDAFGDCGNGRTNVFHHTDASVTDAAQLEVVYQFVPGVSIHGKFDGVAEALTLLRDETFAGLLGDTEIAATFDEAARSFIGRIRNEASEAICDVRVAVVLDGDSGNFVEATFDGLTVRGRETFDLPVAGMPFSDWTVQVETFTCTSAPAGMAMASGEGGEGGEGGEESSPTTPITESIAGTRGDQAFSFSFDPETELFVGTVENISATNVVCGSRTEIHLGVGGNVVELGPTIPEDLAPGDILDVVMYLHPFPSGEMVTYQLHPETSVCP